MPARSSSCWPGLLGGRCGGSRWRAPTGWDDPSPSSWRLWASRSWTCRPPWPPGRGLLNTGGGRKTDTADAASVAQAALHCPTLRTVAVEDQTSILRLLAERRDDLAGERTRILNCLHGLLRDLVPGGAPTDLTAAKAAALIRRVRPTTTAAACRRQLARDLLGDLRRVDARLADNKAQLREALAVTGTTLTKVHGLGVG